MNVRELKKAVRQLPAAVLTVGKAQLKMIKGSTEEKDRELLLDLALMADLHTDADTLRNRTNVLRLALAGLSSSFTPDAVIMAGDITNSAHIKEYKLLRKLCSVYLKGQRILPELGNHDTRGTSIFPYYGEAKTLFLRFCDFCRVNTDKVYYKTVINGYYIICLGSETLLQNEAYLSDGQLEWLDDTLTEAEKNGKPVFIVNHQPPEGRNGVGLLWKDGGAGEQSERLEAILKKYSAKQKIVFISGHLHKTLQRFAFEKDENGIIYLNLPSVEYDGGTGYRIKVTEDEIKFIPYDYINGRPLYLPQFTERM